MAKGAPEARGEKGQGVKALMTRAVAWRNDRVGGEGWSSDGVAGVLEPVTGVLDLRGLPQGRAPHRGRCN